MSPSSRHPVEDSSLSDSAYEFITTDDESQDGLATESLRSFDDTRPDDLRSLASTERSESGIDTESESEGEQEEEQQEQDNHSQASSIQYAEETLNSPSPRLSAHSGVWSVDDTPHATPLARSIEFPENKDSINIRQVSVKHTIRDFTTEEVVAMTKSMNLPEAPKRLIATIRQTMASHCTSPQHPVRLMYVGSPSARGVIVDKIASALAAGAEASGDAVCKSGPTKAPNVELQKKAIDNTGRIKLKHCTSARETIYEGSQFPGETVYSITIDDKQSYESVFRPSGSVIEPRLALPDLAVFYVTARDDNEAVQTREAAWGFMRRHSVPCIFISDSQVFSQPASAWASLINQHAVHLCLEASDNAARPTRLPIDLVSFLNIDDRQMNRNFAYLTGLSERTPDRVPIATLVFDFLETMNKERRRVWTALEGANISVASILSAVLLVLLACIGEQYLRSPAVLQADQIASTAAGATVTPSVIDLHSIESDQTAIINLTSSTSTSVQIPRANASPSNTAVAPFSNFLPDIIPETVKTPICSAEVYGSNGILIKIPLSTKTTWLAKDSITIDVLRDGQAVKTKFSSIDEGLLIEIPRKEAHGVITVTVVTSRKPKVNETFEVNFGKTITEQFYGLVEDAKEKMADTAVDVAALVNLAKESWSVNMKETTDRLNSGASGAAEYAKHAWKDLLQSQQMVQVQNGAARALGQLDERAELMNLYVLRAQIASRLWWLKLQGKTEEHDDYRSRGQSFLAAKSGDYVKARKAKLANGKAKCGSTRERFWNRSGGRGCKKSSR